MAAFRQGKQLVIKAYSTCHKYGIVGCGPTKAPALVRWNVCVATMLLVKVWGPDWSACFYSDTAIESGKSHPVTESVRQHASVDTTCANEDKCGEEAK